MRTRFSRSGLLLLWAGPLLACGKRGDPLPPLQKRPRPVEEARLAQRGNELVLSYATPRATTGGERLPVMEIEIARAEGSGDFAKLARAHRVKAAPGETLAEREPLPAVGALIRFTLQVRVGKDTSSLFNLPAFTVRPAPEPPKNAVAALVPEGIRLRWTPAPLPTPSPTPSPDLGEAVPATAHTSAPAPSSTPTTLALPATPPAAQPAPSAAPASPVSSPAAPLAASAGPAAPAVTAGAPAARSPTPEPKPTPPTAGTHLYRRSSDGEYDESLTPDPSPESSYLDAGVPLDARVCYELRTVVSTSPLVESLPTSEICLIRRDVVPPQAPRGLTALEATGGVDLEWSPSPDADVVAYRVYRAVLGAEAQRIAEVAAPATRFRDDELPEARVLIYSVAAVDGSGNEGPSGPPAQARRPERSR